MIAGKVKDLAAVPRVLASGIRQTTGTIYCVIRLELDGDADDGLFWDTDGGGGWVAGGSVVSWPTATHTTAGVWVYQLPAAASSGKVGAAVPGPQTPGRLRYFMTDNVGTPGSATIESGDMEEGIFPTDLGSLQDVIEADWTINTATTPWKRNTYKKGTTTALITAKDLKTVSGSNITAQDQFVGQEVQP